MSFIIQGLQNLKSFESKRTFDPLVPNVSPPYSMCLPGFSAKCDTKRVKKYLYTFQGRMKVKSMVKNIKITCVKWRKNPSELLNKFQVTVKSIVLGTKSQSIFEVRIKPLQYNKNRTSINIKMPSLEQM